MARRFRKMPLLLLLLLLPVVVLALMSLFAKQPDNLGVSDGRLASCPASPNCVSTQAEDAAHKMEPIPYSGSADDALDRLRLVIENMPRTKIVTAGDHYLHAEFTSLLFRFVDDVEIYVDENEQLIHFRSASRIGHSDFGANRARMEKIRAEYERAVSERGGERI